MSINENTSGLTGACSVLTIDDRKFAVYPLSDRYHDQMHNWVRGEFMRRVEELQPSDRVLQIAIARAVTLNYIMGEGRNLFTTVDGMAYCLHLLTKEEVSFPECLEVIKEKVDHNPAQKIYDKWHELCVVPLKNSFRQVHQEKTSESNNT